MYKIDPAVNVSVVAGMVGQSGYSGDGNQATGAQLNHPEGLAFDAAGNLYIADRLNMRIRKVDPSGVITTFAGGGTPTSSSVGDGGPATSAMLLGPSGIAVDSGGNLYIADSFDNRIRKVSPGGTFDIRRKRRGKLFRRQRPGYAGWTLPAVWNRNRFLHTCQLCDTKSFDYLTELQRHARELTANPAAWMPWNYREALKAAGVG